MEDELNLLAAEIDQAIDQGDTQGVDALLTRCDEALKQAGDEERAIIQFYKSNCYSVIADASHPEPTEAPDWHQDDRIPEVLSLRRAITEPGFSTLCDVMKCKIYTNLGNRLNQIGRPIEAIRYWDSALSLSPNFVMALGNKAFGVSFYGRLLHDPGHRVVMLAAARNCLKRTFQGDALWDGGYFPDIASSFKQHHEKLDSLLKEAKYDEEFDYDQFSLGGTEAETSYRKWCLRNRLFLSPLNDIHQTSIAARDILHLPSHTYEALEEPRFPKYFNTLKQEYVTARFFLYEGTEKQWEKTHISDHDVLLIDGFDAAQFGYRTEQMKTAFRLAYSLFDKISIFINDYFDLSLKVGGLSFNKVWGYRDHGRFVLRDRFSESQNWPLRGLYYLSKDLFDDNFKDVSLPEAQQLADIRHKLEHRFLSLQSYNSGTGSTESLTYITIDDFYEKTLKIMSIARESLIYLCLAMQQEEIMKPKDDSKVFMPISSMPITRD